MDERRGTADRATTRDRILHLAADRFAERGYRDTSVSALAREVGVSPSTAYFHFPDKETLFTAAFDRQATALCDAVIGDPERIGSGYWEAAFTRLAVEVPNYPLVHRVISGLEPGLMVRLVGGELSHRLRVALAESIRLGQMEGGVRGDIDPGTVAIGLESIFTALLLTAVQAGGTGRGDRAPAVRELLRLALAAD